MNRRNFLTASAAVAAGALVGGPALADALLSPLGAGPAGLVGHARAALDRHGARVVHRDMVAVADFGRNSALPRFHFVDLHGGRIESFLVAHGRGSDPAHTGWLQRFSNLPGSEATSSGAFLTGDVYQGAHGHSRRLEGLDPDNDQALARGIVVHGAWYVSPELAAKGAIGRSQGCFALREDQVAQVIDRLGTGRLIVAVRA